jgi:D-tyrosyl-tRNA(Tyr) deacylase
MIYCSPSYWRFCGQQRRRQPTIVNNLLLWQLFVVVGILLHDRQCYPPSFAAQYSKNSVLLAVSAMRIVVQRLIQCKLWPNSNTGGLWKHSVKQKQYDCLLVSQFTLYGTLSKKSYQPDYKLAMKSIPARELYDQFVQMVSTQYDPTKVYNGVFGAMMDVSLINDGPVTVIIESRLDTNTTNREPPPQQLQPSAALTTATKEIDNPVVGKNDAVELLTFEDDVIGCEEHEN